MNTCTGCGAFLLVDEVKHHPGCPIMVGQVRAVLRPISGGSAAAVLPLIAALGPVLVEEIPKAINALLNIINIARDHPATPDAMKAKLDDVAAHLDRTAAAIAAVTF